MIIKQFQQGQFTQQARGMLRNLTNPRLSLIDLLMRESIQNSLDASAIGAQYVDYDISIKPFSSKSLAANLEGISERLIQLAPKDIYRSLVITDKNTLGLNGSYLSRDNTNPNRCSNFWKLVYSFNLAQTADGAGGSHGEGKVIYSKIGIGLVIYYTRIKLLQGGYESRLAAVLIEDESLDTEKRILNNNDQLGIACWGKLDEQQNSIPIIDNEEINSILSIFDIAQFNETETGTKVIIPYINIGQNESRLMNNYSNENDENRLANFIKNSIYKWYSPRLNKNYGTPYLVASVNGEKLGSLESMPKIYQIIRSLYNKAKEIDDGYNKFTNDVIVKKFNAKGTVIQGNDFIGTLACVKLLSKDFPNLNISDVYDELLPPNSDKVPIFCYTRKPGMIINYEPIENRRINFDLQDNELILCFFVANGHANFSKNIRLENSDRALTIEEYFRSSELADHYKWADPQILKGDKLHTISIFRNIKTDLYSLLNRTYGQNQSETDGRSRSDLGYLLGQFILPPKNHGRGSSNRFSPRQNNNVPRRQNRNVINYSTITINYNQTQFQNNFVQVPAIIDFKKPQNCVNISLFIETDNNKNISADAWEQGLGIRMPFEIYSISCDLVPVSPSTLHPDAFISLGRDLEVKFNYSKENKVCVSVSIKTKNTFEGKKNIQLMINFNNKKYSPFISTEFTTI